MTISELTRAERGVDALIEGHRCGTKPIVILLHDDEMEFCPESNSRARDLHRAQGKQEAKGKHIVLRMLRELLYGVRQQKKNHSNEEPQLRSAAATKDFEVRRATRLSNWRGPFLQGGAPGLGKSA
jgi:hypothetical protein